MALRRKLRTSSRLPTNILGSLQTSGDMNNMYGHAAAKDLYYDFTNISKMMLILILPYNVVVNSLLVGYQSTNSSARLSILIYCISTVGDCLGTAPFVSDDCCSVFPLPALIPTTSSQCLKLPAQPLQIYYLLCGHVTTAEVPSFWTINVAH